MPALPPPIDELATCRLATGAGDLWRRGTTARFLDAVGDGSLPREAFERWLVQDYLFVRGFTSFVALAAARIPWPEQRVVLGGLAALGPELEWFEEHAAERDLDLGTAPHPVCRRYVDFLLAAGYTRPWGEVAAIFFGVEVAYTVGWGQLLPASGPYAPFIERWTHPEFAAYVVELMRITDRHPHPGQQPAFDEVMRHEEDFWRMTWEG